MVTEIARRLLARRPNASAEWLQKLPQMARRLEESLLRAAASLEEYLDRSTLRKRRQVLAILIGQRASPATPPAPSLNIRLHKVPEGDDTFFKVKTTTKLQKIFDVYATARYPGRSLRFLLDGERLALVHSLKTKWEEVNKIYQSTSVLSLDSLDTIGKVKRKEQCEAQLAQIEKDIRALRVDSDRKWERCMRQKSFDEATTPLACYR